ncbi:6305_t:CDS:1, partial [Scutellospora calospora]
IFSEDNYNNQAYPIPIHLELEIMVQLNKKPFIICVVCNIHSLLQPGYICEDSGQSSSIVTSTSMALTSVYQTVFGTKTKFSELAYLGLNQIKTTEKLLKDVVFQPFIVKLENIAIYVSSLGQIICSNPNKVGCNYKAALFYKFKVKQSVFSQCINNDNSYLITIYQDSKIVGKYKSNSPNAVWLQIRILKSISGDSLFAINHPTTLHQLEQVYKTKFCYQILIPDKCTPADWNNEIIMNHLFELHLKKAVSKSKEE